MARSKTIDFQTGRCAAAAVCVELRMGVWDNDLGKRSVSFPQFSIVLPLHRSDSRNLVHEKHAPNGSALADAPELDFECPGAEQVGLDAEPVEAGHVAGAVDSFEMDHAVTSARLLRASFEIVWWDTPSRVAVRR